MKILRKIVHRVVRLLAPRLFFVSRVSIDFISRSSDSYGGNGKHRATNTIVVDALKFLLCGMNFYRAGKGRARGSELENPMTVCTEASFFPHRSIHCYEQSAISFARITAQFAILRNQ